MKGQRNLLLKWMECEPQSGELCQECSENMEGLHRAVRRDVTVKARENHSVGGGDWEQIPRGSQKAGQRCWRPFPPTLGQFVLVPLFWKSDVMSTKLLLSTSAVLGSLPFTESCVCTGGSCSFRWGWSFAVSDQGPITCPLHSSSFQGEPSRGGMSRIMWESQPGSRAPLQGAQTNTARTCDSTAQLIEILYTLCFAARLFLAGRSPQFELL